MFERDRERVYKRGRKAEIKEKLRRDWERLKFARKGERQGERLKNGKKGREVEAGGKKGEIK